MRAALVFVAEWAKWTGAIVALYWLHTLGWAGIVAASAIAGLGVTVAINSAAIVLEVIEGMIERDTEELDAER